MYVSMYAYIVYSFMYRILVQHMDEFKSQAKTVPRHIPSRYSKEMASKSDVVSAKVQRDCS